mgnify:CR=1 FL=1
MAVTQTDIDALDAAIANSELRVEIDGRSVTYRSMDDLLKARAHLSNVVAATGASTARRAYQYRFLTARGD